MKTATIEEAKERLEDLILAARAGERVEITQGGEPVVSLVAEPTADLRHLANAQERDAALLADLEARGLVLRSTLTPDEKADVDRLILTPLPDTGPSGVLEALLEERRTGR